MILRQERGQNILDYAIVLLVVITALMIMGYYVRNTLSGKMRDSADSIGKGETYRPYKTTNTTLIENR